MKKFALLFFASLFVCVFMLTANAGTYGDLTYSISNGEVTITGCSDYYVTDIIIPDKIERYPVTKIGDTAFYRKPRLTTITIPDSVTSIGDSAFYYCTSLTSITIPDSVVSIDNWAFYNCTSLKSITIPDGVTTIGRYAFSYCKSLTSITIPDSVTSIGSEAFRDCTRLTSITIPNSVTAIVQYLFYNCTSLTSITIPDSVTSIGYNAFEDCTSLTSVTIGNSVTSIGDLAFDGCKSLTAIEVNEANKKYCDIDGVLFNKDKTTLIQYPSGNARTSYTIPDSVTNIGSYSFRDCTSLKSVTISESVTSIGTRALGYCYDSGYKVVNGFTIYGYAGSTAETYANNNSIPFVKIIDIDITDYSLLLEGSIGLKFYLDIKGTSDAAAKFIYDNTEYTAEIGEEDGKYFAIFYLAPKDMSGEVTLNVSAGEESDSVTVSISDYIEYINKNSEEYTESLSLVNAISDYNTYANAYFNEKTVEDVVLTSEEVSEIEEIVSPKLTSAKLNGLRFHSTSLILEDTTTIRHYFKIENLNIFDVSNYTVEGGTPLKVNGEYAYTDIENIPSHKLSEQKTVKISDGQNESNITFSVLNYVKLTYKKEDTRLSNLVKSLYRYSVEAEKYNS